MCFIMMAIANVLASGPFQLAQTCCPGCTYGSSCCCAPDVTKKVTITAAAGKVKATPRAVAGPQILPRQVLEQHLCPKCPAGKPGKKGKFCCRARKTVTSFITRSLSLTTIRTTTSTATVSPTFEPLPDGKQGVLLSDVTYQDVIDAIPNQGKDIVATETEEIGVKKYYNTPGQPVQFTSVFKSNRTIKALVLRSMSISQQNNSWVLVEDASLVQPFAENVKYTVNSIQIVPGAKGDSVRIVFTIRPNVCSSKITCMLTAEEAISVNPVVFLLNIGIDVYSTIAGKKRALALEYDEVDQSEGFAVGKAPISSSTTISSRTTSRISPSTTSSTGESTSSSTSQSTSSSTTTSTSESTSSSTTTSTSESTSSSASTSTSQSTSSSTSTSTSQSTSSSTTTRSTRTTATATVACPTFALQQRPWKQCVISPDGQVIVGMVYETESITNVNGGAWVVRNLPNPAGASGFALSYNGSVQLFSQANDKLTVSIDYGQTYQQVGTPSAWRQPAISYSGNTMAVGIPYVGVMVSRDLGQSWVLEPGTAGPNVFGVAITPQDDNPTLTITGFQDIIYQVTNGASTTIKSGGNYWAVGASSDATHVLTGDAIFSPFSFYSTADNGGAWTTFGPKTEGWYVSSSMSASGQEQMICSTGGIPQVSQDGGSTFKQPSDLPVGAWSGSVAANGDTMIACMSEGYMWKSEDAGTSWCPIY
jgi:hypothetical protein